MGVRHGFVARWTVGVTRERGLGRMCERLQDRRPTLDSPCDCRKALSGGYFYTHRRLVVLMHTYRHHSHRLEGHKNVI